MIIEFKINDNSDSIYEAVREVDPSELSLEELEGIEKQAFCNRGI